MLDILALALIFLSLGLTALMLLVLSLTFTCTAIAYTIWKERGGSVEAVIQPILPPMLQKRVKEGPDGFKKDWQFYRDPETGRESLLPSEEVAKLLKEQIDEDESAAIEMAELDAYINGEVNGFHSRPAK